MNSETIPKGVIFSNVFMSLPFMTLTMYLGLISPMVGQTTVIDPTYYAFLARSALRLLSLNLAFYGGIHYGLASATYETAITEEELNRVKYQMLYSFVPGIVAFGTS